MDPHQIRSGDWVEFFDTDQTRWGPWRVRSVEGLKARVEVDGVMEDLIPLSRLRRVPSDRSL